MKRKFSSVLLALALVAAMMMLLARGSDLPASAQRLATGLSSGSSSGKAADSKAVEGAVADIMDSNAAVPVLAGVAIGKPIMNKMPNMTARAELGRAGWKMLHTMLAQYPEKPDKDARTTLMNYLHLFSRIYPCGECAEHFQQLLKDHPPQLSSRKAAVMWGCDAHNKVNKRLDKPIFDCAHIDDLYDCGCGSPEDDLKAQEEEEAFQRQKAKNAKAKAGKIKGDPQAAEAKQAAADAKDDTKAKQDEAANFKVAAAAAKGQKEPAVVDVADTEPLVPEIKG